MEPSEDNTPIRSSQSLFDIPTTNEFLEMTSPVYQSQSVSFITDTQANMSHRSSYESGGKIYISKESVSQDLRKYIAPPPGFVKPTSLEDSKMSNIELV